MALLNCGKVIVFVTSQAEKVLKGHHTKCFFHFKAEKGLSVANPILLAKTENSISTSPFNVLFRYLQITYYVYM